MTKSDNKLGWIFIGTITVLSIIASIFVYFVQYVNNCCYPIHKYIVVNIAIFIISLFVVYVLTPAMIWALKAMRFIE